MGETAIGEAAERRTPIQIPDVQNDPSSLVLDVIVRAGFRALLIVPLLGAHRIVGALVGRRKEAGEFPQHPVDLLQTSPRNPYWRSRTQISSRKWRTRAGSSKWQARTSRNFW